MLESSQLRFKYSGQTEFLFPDLHCAQGEQLLILGNSGSGKTTLLHLLAGLLRPLQGKVQLGGTDLTQMTSNSLDKFRGKNIGLIFQRPHFIQSLSVKDNISLASRLSGIAIQETQVMQLATQLGIADQLEKKPRYLSQGQQQRAGILRALIHQPKLLLADEPTSSLDDYHCAEVVDLLLSSAKAANAALVMVTHDQRIKERFSQKVTL